MGPASENAGYASRLEPLRHEGKVNAVAFAPAGNTVLTGSLDMTARLRRLARVTGDPFPDWTLTSMGSHHLDPSTWEERRQRLQHLAGPPPLE